MRGSFENPPGGLISHQEGVAYTCCGRCLTTTSPCSRLYTNTAYLSFLYTPAPFLVQTSGSGPFSLCCRCFEMAITTTYFISGHHSTCQIPFLYFITQKTSYSRVFSLYKISSRLIPFKTMSCMQHLYTTKIYNNTPGAISLH